MTVMTVMLGGAVGSGLRYGLSLLFNPSATVGMPWGTLMANVAGCLLIGWLSTFLSDASEAVRLGVLVGVLGGFTTFSSFGLETLRLLQAGQIQAGIAYLLISNVGGLLGVWVGTRLST
jgi:CrcB protein